MSLGEYISVSSQRDSEQAMLAKEKEELRTDPQAELDELVRLLQGRGLSRPTATQVATELTEHDALAAHAQIELGVDPEEIVNPLHAALASVVAFTLGAALPLIAILLPGPSARVPVTVAAVLVALAIAGAISARIGASSVRRAVLRVVIGGAAGLALTYGIGHLFGTAVS
jgi:VIT1/CCC1 family predicted Fe2+/Mn2+ transporter